MLSNANRTGARELLSLLLNGATPAMVGRMVDDLARRLDAARED